MTAMRSPRSPALPVASLPAEKIQAWHRDRLAVVYVRQSTPQQVLDHQESTRLQYGLAQQAQTLGWPPPASWSSMTTWASRGPVPAGAPAFNGWSRE